MRSGRDGGLTGQADADAKMDLQKQEQQYFAANYANPNRVGLFNRPAQPTTTGRPPSQAFPTPQPNLTAYYDYDPVQRRLVLRPASTLT
jgi:hypothetical protein